MGSDRYAEVLFEDKHPKIQLCDGFETSKYTKNH